MSVIKINAITVPADSGDELAQRFAARTGAVDGVDGFEGFELLKPTDDRTVWLVITRWRDEEAFEAWKTSPAFAHGHRGVAAGEHAGAHGHAGHGEGGHAGEHAGPHGHGGEHAGGHGHGGKGPVGVSAELWSYEVAGGTGTS
ncbi:antibiotic biosynthesis monooxygenase family protein [Mumia sp. DW29H23]|uniref:antibiotic biosynthesis monooxygenase family protein n=1 Tax=Mumia sp. DW29H23 TaxID=3421241 RepID=UPI003D69BB71